MDDSGHRYSRSATPLFSEKSELQFTMEIPRSLTPNKVKGKELADSYTTEMVNYLTTNAPREVGLSTSRETFSASSERFDMDFPKKNLKKYRRYSDVGPRRGSMSKQLRAIQDADDNSVFRKIFLNPNNDKFDWDADGSVQSLTLTDGKCSKCMSEIVVKEYRTAPVRIRARVEGWEIKASELEVGDVVGMEQVGLVRAGSWNGHSVTLKLLPEAAPFGGAEYERLIAEINVHARIRHPHVVNFMGVCMHRENNYMIVRESTPGGSIEDLYRIKRAAATQWCTWRPPKRQVAEWSHQLVLAVNYLHLTEPKIVHRDLNPSVLFLSASGVLKVGGFSHAENIMDDETCTVPQCPSSRRQSVTESVSTEHIRSERTSKENPCTQGQASNDIDHISLNIHEDTSDLMVLERSNRMGCGSNVPTDTCGARRRFSMPSRFTHFESQFNDEKSAPWGDVVLKSQSHHHSELVKVSQTCVDRAVRRKSSADGRRISLQSIDCPDVMEEKTPLEKQRNRIYMAPEMCLDDSCYDEKVDIFSMAMIMWFMSTGEIPYHGMDEERVAALVSNEQEQLRPNLTKIRCEKTKHIVESSWCHNSRDRLSAEQIMEELELILSSSAKQKCCSKCTAS